MRHIDGGLLFAPSDLGDFVACEHLTQLETAAAFGEIAKPHFANPYGDLIARKGDEHEAAFLAGLRAAGREVVEVGLEEDRDFEAGARRTAEAMRAGVEFVYQAPLVLGGWRGLADFLERVARPSALGPWSYDVLDTKLARHARPAHALQLCFYSSAVARIQGVEPEVAHIVLGTSERHTIRLADVSAYYRRLCRQFEASVAARPETAPYPVEHCSICAFRRVCEARWEEEDHLVRVAGIRRDQIERLAGVGVATLTGLAESAAELTVPKLRADTFAGLREQAGLQLIRARTGVIERRLRPLEPGRGFGRLPKPSLGDVVLDLEGHPFFEPARGLEFLFGLLVPESGDWRYRSIWAHDRDGERRGLEEFVDLAHARLARFPDLHVYHFGSYESSAVKRLMGEHGTREAEIDDFLRRAVLVDLHTVLRQAMRAGVPGYGLKELEALAGFERTASVGSGDEAILAYERWLQSGDPSVLDAIAAYNEEDCRATLALRDWLFSIRPAEAEWPELPPVREVPEEAAEAVAARERLRQALIAGADAGGPRPAPTPTQHVAGEPMPVPAPGAADAAVRWLAGELLEYHRREARPAWWAYFDRQSTSPEELIDETEAIGRLELDPDAEPEPLRRSLIYTLRYPEQQHTLGPGSLEDPSTGQGYEVLEVDDATGTLRLVRGAHRADEPLPRALMTGGPYRDWQQRDALTRLGASILAGDGRYPALRSVLGRELPRFRGRDRGEPIQTIKLEQQKALARELDSSYLFVQGPPGSGKTWTGARLVVDLVASGRRVGIAAQSHKAIHNLLAEVERVAQAEGVSFRGLKKCSADNEESVYEGDLIESSESVYAFLDEEVGLVAGTAWLFAREELDSTLDYLVIDEAGQVSLADALAMGTSAANVILLGDPLQLAQVSQGVHPPGTGASVLEHLLADAPTIPEDRGLFLERSFRMHPEVCGFVSEVVYAGRLYSDESAARRSTSAGTGIRFVPVEHEGNRAASDEEVERVAAEIARLRGGAFSDEHGDTRPLRDSDFMVVAPYNAQVRRLRAGLPEGVRVGTVDKFQGQEAPIVFFSMATSSGEDVPRNLAFLFSRNRLNVAISRAQCLAVLVCSPRLLEARCRSIEEMQLVNALCRLVEVAEESGSPPSLLKYK